MDSKSSGKMSNDVPCSTASLFAGCAWYSALPHARIWGHTHHRGVDLGGDCVVMIPESCMHACCCGVC
jgi:hypothetical protein